MSRIRNAWRALMGAEPEKRVVFGPVNTVQAYKADVFKGNGLVPDPTYFRSCCTAHTRTVRGVERVVLLRIDGDLFEVPSDLYLWRKVRFEDDSE